VIKGYRIPGYRLKTRPPETAPDGEVMHVAYFEELPGCIGQGDTPEKAEAMARSLLPRFIEHLMISGMPVPAPLGSGVRLTSRARENENVGATSATAVFVRTEVSVSKVPTGASALPITQRILVA
jgi:predicted RNase H-like HicB family nuclease